jgi:two-component system response regulator FixJ
MADAEFHVARPPHLPGVMPAQATATVPPQRQVHLVDDDPEVLKSLALLLRSAGYRVVAHGDAWQLLAALDRDPEAGCAVVDLSMPGMDGITLARAIHARPVPVPVVIVTGHADVAMAVRALREGALDLIEKPYDDSRLLDSVAQALAAHEAALARSRDQAAAAARLAALSAREREVFDALVEGLSNKAVATRLGISVRTVEAHRANLMQRLGAESLPELVRLAFVAGGRA